ncbi:uncharacterized protein LOC135847046 [Planococcus citri]|uniref:uncharacterized protein LOC135847046 n=1 Tax=Planococcus citri TaxID=170843 RepID=UPI0031F7DAF0
MVGSLSMEANSSNNINQEINPASKDIPGDGIGFGGDRQQSVNTANGSALVPITSASSTSNSTWPSAINVNNTSTVPVAAGNIGCDNDSRVGNGSRDHIQGVLEKSTTTAAVAAADNNNDDEDGGRKSPPPSPAAKSSSSSSSEDIHHVKFQEVKDDDGHRVQFNDSSDDENHPDEISFPSSSSSSSSSSEDGDSEYCESKAPDGGYGWVIVFASFMVNLIADGVTFSFGVIYVELVDYFGEGKSKTAWIGSLFAAIPLLSGPFASYLTDRYGCRKVSIVGGMLAALGFIISAFIESIEMLYLTFGILSGFGLSLCYVAAIVIVAYYFEKRRSFATGLSVCGSGIGTFIFPPFIDYLISEYGWRGTTLILAGLFLNLCVCGAVMRDLEYTKKKKKKKDRKLSSTRQTRSRVRTNTASSMDSSSQYSQYYTPSVPSTEEFKRLLQIAAHESTIKEDEDDDDANATDANEISTKEKRNRLFSSLVSLPTFVKNGEKVPLEVLEGLSTNRHLYAVLVHNYPSLLISSRSISDSGYINDQQKRNRNPYSMTATPKYSAQFLPNSKPTSPLLKSPSKEDQTQTPVSETIKENEPAEVKSPIDDNSAGAEFIAKKPEKRRSILKKKSESLKRGLAAVSNTNNTWWNKRYASDYGNESPRLPTAYLRDLKVHRHSLTYRGAMLNISRYRLRASSCPDIYRNSMTTIAEEKDEWYAGLLDLWYAVTEMLDFSFFTNISFLLFAISNFLLYTWYDVPYIFLADYAVEQGYSKTNATYIISVIGILNMLGEIGYGWAGDRSWLSSRCIYAVSMALCGLFVALIPLVTSYENLCVISGGFGLLVAANYSLTSIILVETISLEKFTNAYGLLLLVQGIGNLVGPPIAGWLYEVTGSFMVPFFLAGFFIIISGFLLEVGSFIDLVKNRYIKPNADSNSIMSCVESNEILKSKSNCNNHTTYVP